MAAPDLVLYYLKAEAEVTRLGFAVGKKVGGAVVRNRIKRLLREAVKEMPERFMSGYDLVLLARKPIRNATLAQIKTSLTDLFKRIRP